ncbi:MAG: lipopolysaccharide heptosyltransferase II [Phycisphaerae bacterium]|nr:lipopolysaccharide heptosyltransferase II [Phycisphaerae bacterium]
MAALATSVPKRALVVAPSWVGDAVMASAAFRALRAAWHGTHIALLCRPGIDQVLAGLPFFDEIIVDRMAGVFGPIRRGAALRRRRFDCAVLFPNSFRTALAARFAGIPRRVGYARDGRGRLLTQAIEPPPRGSPASTVDYYSDLVERGLGITIRDRAPALALTDAERAAGTMVLSGVPSEYAVLVPGGSREQKRWPADRFARVAEHLARRHGLAVVATGSPNERSVIDAMRGASSEDIVDLSARGIDLGALKAVISGAAIVVTNDTGPRHLAAAFRVKTVALFGPTDHRWTILAGVPERLIVAEPFLPEELVADDRPEFCAIDRISVGDVVAAVDAMLRTNATLER